MTTKLNVLSSVGACVVGIAVFALGYDSGFGQGLRSQKAPTTVFGDQIINNSNNYWSPDAGTASNSEHSEQNHSNK